MRIIILTIIILSGGLISYGQPSIISHSASFSCKSKNILLKYSFLDEIPLSRKVQRMVSLENGIYKLPFSKEHIRGVILPEINAERAVLAPHFPKIVKVFNEEKEALLATWIASFPLEYDNLSLYLQTYLRSNTH